MFVVQSANLNGGLLDLFQLFLVWGGNIFNYRVPRLCAIIVIG